MARRPAFTDSQIDELLALYQARATVRDLATHFSVSERTIRRYLICSGIEISDHRVKLSTEQVQAVRRLYESGISTIELGVRYRVDPETIATALRHAGVVLRPCGAYRTISSYETDYIR
jgi:hypothetical protein